MKVHTLKTHPEPFEGRERPILFSGAMIRAILAGRKTQTRRIVKAQPGPASHAYRHPEEGWWTFGDNSGRTWKPYAEVGDRLWVRETFGYTCDAESKSCIVYRADDAALSYLCEDSGQGDPVALGGPTKAAFPPAIWKPSIFMPRWASRITLAVESVRIERLHDISEADAKAEGVEPSEDNDTPWVCYEPECVRDGGCSGVKTARESFFTLWRSINGRESYDANPWTWTIPFSPLASPEEEERR